MKKNIKKAIIAFSAVALLTAGASAQDSEDFEDMESFEDTSSPELTINGEVNADSRVWGGNVNKDGVFNAHKANTAHDWRHFETDSGAKAKLNLNYSGDYTDMNLKVKLDSRTIGDHPEDVIDEASVGGSFAGGRIQLRAGKMKEVWGKGDKIHVLDNFNANDYTDFIFPDYIDRRLGEIMFKATANLSWDYNIKLEGICTPTMTADRFAEKGTLAPYAQKNLTNTVKSLIKAKYTGELSKSLGLTQLANGSYGYVSAPSTTSPTVVATDKLLDGIMELSDFSADNLYEDNIKTLKYGQAGARLTGTAWGIDWGTSYYYGHYKQPSANLENVVKMGVYEAYAKKAAAQAAALTAAGNTAGAAAAQAQFQTYAAAAKGILAQDMDDILSLNYDQVQVFGLEAAFVLWKFNTRWEGAYNLTQDYAGDNPWIKNNSLSWVAGFDIDLPIHNLNFNFQNTGTHVLNSDKIKKGGIDIGGTTVPWTMIGSNYDVDYNSDGHYTINKLIFVLKDTFLHEKLSTEAQVIVGVENHEVCVVPKIDYNVSEGLTFTAKAAWLYSRNENGEFYNFTQGSRHHDKVFVQVAARYQF